jgi:hypothetical protein
MLLTSATAVFAQRAAPANANADVVGKWEFTVTSPQGENTMTVTFARASSGLTGTAESQMGSLNLLDVMIAQNDLSFTMRFEADGQTFDIPFKGKVTGAAAEGAATINMGDAPTTMPWKAKKLPPG